MVTMETAMLKSLQEARNIYDSYRQLMMTVSVSGLVLASSILTFSRDFNRPQNGFWQGAVPAVPAAKGGGPGGREDQVRDQHNRTL